MAVDAPFRITHVRTRDSHASPGEPVSFREGRGWRPVDEVLDRWYEGSADPERPIILVLKIRSGDDLYLLRYLNYFDRWQVRPCAEETV